MTSIPNPDDWMDVFTIIVVAAIVAVPSLLTLRNHRSLDEVKQQVVNGHKTPMRSDLDRVIVAIDALGHDVAGLRTDLADEEDRRRSHIRELREELDRRVNDLHRKIGDPRG